MYILLSNNIFPDKNMYVCKFKKHELNVYLYTKKSKKIKKKIRKQEILYVFLKKDLKTYITIDFDVIFSFFLFKEEKKWIIYEANGCIKIEKYKHKNKKNVFEKNNLKIRKLVYDFKKLFVCNYTKPVEKFLYLTKARANNVRACVVNFISSKEFLQKKFFLKF
ncbi:hypothetical protein CPARA_3gp453 (nucleomorph) [Cryptomonas paramecium]|uniref:Uncharacterized protein n=1 Tax=Cryptomonas paramaecium TaxID=2898 RepID=F2HI48_9CRYP|nr:hypothetical protein CPARA_3gp453 [Cryptomonas paramecium]AEA39111.1 hypothetical protein CPARA_3gp453 [Cryptomonas paramecium]